MESLTGVDVPLRLREALRWEDSPGFGGYFALEIDRVSSALALV